MTAKVSETNNTITSLDIEYGGQTLNIRCSTDAVSRFIIHRLAYLWNKQDGNMILKFDYVNYKGEASVRRVRFKSVRFGSSPWHQQPQWLMLAYDFDKGDEREFALKDMTNVEETA